MLCAIKRDVHLVLAAVQLLLSVQTLVRIRNELNSAVEGHTEICHLKCHAHNALLVDCIISRLISSTPRHY